MFAQQLDAYRTIQKSTIDGRELEAHVLVRAAQMLTACRDNWSAADRDVRLTEALKFNQKLWSLFQAELSKSDNPLPRNIREDILSLSAFIDKRIFDVMAFPEPQKLDIIVAININIAAGLRGQ
jgi:flagellar protein FlaF